MFRHFALLLWKSLLLKTRRPITTAVELLLPAVLIVAVVGLFYISKVETIDAQTYILEHTDQVASLAALPYVLAKNEWRLALVADSKDAKDVVADFRARLETLYPGWNGADVGFVTPTLNTVVVPPIGDVIKEFDSMAELDSYVLELDYDTKELPRIFAAIVIESGAPDWNYTIRMNLTDTPTTWNNVDPIARDADPTEVDDYVWVPQVPVKDGARPSGGESFTVFAVPGFMTLMMELDRFIINQFVGTNTSDPILATGADLVAIGQRIGSLYVGLGIPAEEMFAESAAMQNDTAYFLHIVNTVGEAALRSDLYAPNAAAFAPFPTSAYKTNPFYGAVSFFFPIFFVVAISFPVLQLIRGIVSEKELRIREGMRMMGLGGGVLSLSWLLVYSLQFGALALFIMLVTFFNVFQRSNAFLVFIFFWLFGLSSTALAFFVSVWFSKARTAAIWGFIVFLALWFPFTSVSNAGISESTRTWASLASPTAFSLGLTIITSFEDQGVGVTFDNAHNLYSDFRFSTSLLMMTLDTVLYLFLAWYCDNVMPSFLREYGVPLPWYFPCTRAYWRDLFNLEDNEDLREHPGQDNDEVATPGGTKAAPPVIEAPGPALRALEAEKRCVKIRKLTKVFDDKVAVDRVDMDMFEGQIFALLGHNGAGKTTTISMLTGLLPVTSGTATVFGHSIRSDFDEIRHIMGVCPQHDVLWPELTVREHLEIFAGIKGMPPAQVADAIQRGLVDVGLSEKINSQAGSLSGGQKRKLSVLIALIGGSKVVILDEPTSGMDPYSRRATWQVLQNARKDRIILLTTHFMEEADLLGDRICIMAEGKVKCCGSPIFLKSKYGVGYQMTAIKRVQQRPSDPPGCDTQAVIQTVLSAVPGSAVLSNVGTELSFRLPISGSAGFPALFRRFDTDIVKPPSDQTYGIISYGVGVTTMEEVFIRVARGSDGTEAHPIIPGVDDVEDEESQRSGASGVGAGGATARSVVPLSVDAASVASGSSKPSPHKQATETTKVAVAAAAPTAGAAVMAGGGASAAAASRTYGTNPLSGVAWNRTNLAEGEELNIAGIRRQAREEGVVFFRHFLALLTKRFHAYRRDGRNFCCQVLLPGLVVVIGLALLRAGQVTSFPRLVFSTGDFNLEPETGANLENIVPSFSFFTNADTFADAPVIQEVLDRFPEKNASARYFSFAEVPSDGPLFSNDSSYANNPVAWTGVSMSSLLLTYRDNFEASIYGAYAFPRFYFKNNGTEGSFPTPLSFEYLALTNTTADHGVPIYATLLSQALLRQYAPNNKGSITAANMPLPFTQRQSVFIGTIISFFTGIIIVIAFSFVPTAYAVFVVKEREVSAKHQQLISGVSIPAYWLSTYFWDLCAYQVPCWLTLAFLFAFDVRDFTDTDMERINATILLLVLYGFSIAPFTYCISYLFQSHSNAQVAVLVGNFIAMMLMIASFVMRQFVDTCKVDHKLRNLYRIVPAFCLGDGFVSISFRPLLPLIESQCYDTPFNEIDQDKYDSALDWDVAGANIVFMAWTSVAYLLIAVGIDYIQSHPATLQYFMSDPKELPPPMEHEDEDVAAEARRVAAMPKDANEAVVLDNLRKAYPGGTSGQVKHAVRGLSFAVPIGQVFGFLGVNGAGKTSALKVLSGDIIATAGTARLAGYDVLSEQVQCRRLLGYCPQFDALQEMLTVREHLELFARIKNVPEERVESVVRAKMEEMDLVQYEHKRSSQLSGGNKRKLSVAIALIGDPPIVFLDEPSTGMDPVARRHMWKIITRVATERKTCSIILTTHSMEECEALCQRVGIMVSGRLRCLGSIQHLKHRFGRGYTCEVRTAAVTEEALAAVRGIAMQALQLAPKPKEETDATLINLSAINAILIAAGSPHLQREIAPDGAGWMVASELASRGAVSLGILLAWLAEESQAKRVIDFVTQEAFPPLPSGDHTHLIERHGLKLRFAVPSQPSMGLGDMFERIETRKASLAIEDYSIAQTTLEEIFNQFAQTQDEETQHIRGFVSPS